jgi:septal ring factor EnvC (AmiA/AmiB activator)
VSVQEWLLIILTGSELLLLILVVGFFARLRRSEDMLQALQNNQAELMGKLQKSAQLEQELLESFEDRQRALMRLEERLVAREKDLSKLLQQAEEVSRSPDFLRQVVLGGLKKGQTARELAKATGISLDEVELIISQTRRE